MDYYIPSNADYRAQAEVEDRNRNLSDPNLNPTYSTGRYNIGMLRYPRDLGEQENLQYVAFYINVRGKSKFNQDNRLGTVSTEGTSGLTSDQLASGTVAAGGLLGAVGARAAASSLGVRNTSTKNVVTALGGVGGAGATVGLQQTDVFKPDQSQRISSVITLYVDGPPSVTYSAKYANSDLGSLAGLLSQGGAAVKDLVGGFLQGGFDSNFMNNLSKTGGVGAEGAGALLMQLAQLPSVFGATDVKALASASAKVTTNPFREVLFEMMDFRTFKFKYKFMPRDETELSAVEKIIHEFKFHMHPELSNNKFFLIYPADFNIVYYFKGSTNNFVHKIGRCVLTDMNIEYGSGDYTAFSNGKPTEINMALTFQETEMLTKERILAGY